MPASVLEQVKAYIGFDQRDADHLRSLAAPLRPSFPRVVDRFYEEILRITETRKVLSEGAPQLERLKGHFSQWLETLFCGVYDECYAEQRSRIGHTHVRVGLPQHFMLAGMDVVRQELTKALHQARLPAAGAKLESLQKILSIELALMLASYEASSTQKLRETERNAIRERLSRVEHLAEIGQLAASLAHELKNPLAGISGAIEVIRDDLGAEDPRRPILNEVVRHIHRLDGTVKDLLAYARPRTPGFKSIQLAAVVERVVGLLRKEPAFQQVRLECDMASGPRTLEADEHQIEQVMVNLLLNAAHASTAGGTVRLSVNGRDKEVVLLVEDQGHGMDEEVAKRAFEPFFTTKARGTGLGLSICQSIVEAHGGRIALRSTKGKGTRVEVRLPLDQKRNREAEKP